MSETDDIPEPGTLEEALAGLRDGRWRVRWSSVIWLDRRGAPEGLRAVVPMLRDPRARVRLAAVHAIARDRALATEPVASVETLLMERICEDESVRVRRAAIMTLAFHRAHPQLEGFFQSLLDEETDPKLHKAAGIGLLLCRQAGTTGC